MRIRHFHHPETRERRALSFPTSRTLSISIAGLSREVLFEDLRAAADAYVVEVSRWLSLGFRDTPPTILRQAQDLRLHISLPDPRAFSWQLLRGDTILEEDAPSFQDAHTAVAAFNAILTRYPLPPQPPSWTQEVASFPELQPYIERDDSGVITRRFLHPPHHPNLELGPEHHDSGPPHARFLHQHNLQVRSRVQGWVTHLRPDGSLHQIAAYHDDARCGLSFLFHEDGTIAEYRSFHQDTLDWLYRVDTQGELEVTAPHGESQPGQRSGIWTFPLEHKRHHHGAHGALERIEFLRPDGTTRLEHRLWGDEPRQRIFDNLGNQVLEESSLLPERTFLSPDRTRRVTTRIPYDALRVWWDGSTRHESSHKHFHNAVLAHHAQIERWLARGYTELGPWLLFAKRWRLVGLRPPTDRFLSWREAADIYERPYEDLLSAVQAFNKRRRSLADQGYAPIEPLGWLEGIQGPGPRWRELTLYADETHTVVRRRSFQSLDDPQNLLGPVWHYNESGHLRSRGVALEGESVGVEHAYYEDGETLKEIALHDRGALHGRMWSFRPDTGCIWGIFSHDRGRPATRLVLDGYDRPLVRTQDGLDHDGAYLGTWEHFDARHRKVHMYIEGRLRTVEFWRLSDDFLEERHKVADDGSLHVEAFHDNGATRVRGRQNTGRQRVGPWDYFRPSGSLLQRHWYVCDTLREIEVFRENGTLEERVEVRENGERVVHRTGSSPRPGLRLVSNDDA